MSVRPPRRGARPGRCVPAAFAALLLALVPAAASLQTGAPAGADIFRELAVPLVDLADQKERQVVVDREPGRYLGHPTTVLLEDGKTILCVYPQGHGKGAICLKKSADGGRTWTPLRPVGDWGGIVTMGSVIRTGDGEYMALFHDDGRFFRKDGAISKAMTVYKTFSRDGGLTWTVPRELPAALTGDRHTARYAPDGRLFVSFRDTVQGSPSRGDWVAWVGTYADIVAGRPGQYRIRLMDNKRDWDCAYPGVEVLPGGTIVATTYGHWIEGEEPFVVSVRLTLAETDALAKAQKSPSTRNSQD
jgi:hypothetical protein